jgi:hypothetical protein
MRGVSPRPLERVTVVLKMIDRGFAIVLVFGTVGHTFGSITKYGGQPEELLWALCASPFIALLAAPIFCGQFVPMIMLLLGLL